MPHVGANPITTKAFCACAQFGTGTNPKSLLSVQGHRRHRKHPECEQPPYIVNDDGTTERAQEPIGTAAANATKRTARAASRAAAKEAAKNEAAEPLSAEPWSSNDVPDIPLGPPPTITGKASMPAPDPRAGLLTPAPMFTLSIKVTGGLALIWDHVLQLGYDGSFDDFIDQGMKMMARDHLQVAPGLMPVEAL